MVLTYEFEDGSEAIAHYGIKGMRWGHHKPKESYHEKRMRKLSNKVKQRKKQYNAAKKERRIYNDFTSLYNLKTSEIKLAKAQRSYNFEASGKAGKMRKNVGKAAIGLGVAGMVLASSQTIGYIHLAKQASEAAKWAYLQGNHFETGHAVRVGILATKAAKTTAITGAVGSTVGISAGAKLISEEQKNPKKKKK